MLPKPGILLEEVTVGGRMHEWGLEGQDLLGLPWAHPVLMPE